MKKICLFAFLILISTGCSLISFIFEDEEQLIETDLFNDGKKWMEEVDKDVIDWKKKQHQIILKELIFMNDPAKQVKIQ